MSWTLCVDFGTAYSKAAAAPSDAWSHFDPSSIRPLMLGGQDASNPFLLESAVFVDNDRILFGPAAVARAETEDKRVALRSFKTLLAVSDLDRALNTSVPASIDPHRLFSMGDLIALYLAFLGAAIQRAIAADLILRDVPVFERRYAAPAWRSGDSAGLHDTVMRLFGRAETLQDQLGQDVLSPTGVSLTAARNGLDVARSSTRVSDMGLVFEATAAGAYTSIGLDIDAPSLIIVDMGAGTTDIAALARVGARVEELPEARVTLKQAGDYVDHVIANLALTANPKIKSLSEQGRLWRTAIRGMRGLKESLFAEGKAGFRHDGRTTFITMRGLDRSKDFRAFKSTLQRAYDRSFEVARNYAALHGGRELHAVAVGGGASAPFIQELIRRKPPRAGRIQIVARPATPEWAHAREFRGNLAPIFPQLAIAIGGSLAPPAMLATRGAIANPAAVVRTDSRAARD